MNSSRPYLIRALYEWIEDNGLTPYMLVDATGNNVDVPGKFIDNGRIILNISYDATHNLVLGDDAICVLAIYARENGQGMMFGEHDDTPTDPDSGGPTSTKSDSDSDAPSPMKRPKLTIVK